MLIILAMLFLGVLIVILTIVIGFDEDPGRDIPDDTEEPNERLEDTGYWHELRNAGDAAYLCLH